MIEKIETGIQTRDNQKIGVSMIMMRTDSSDAVVR